MPKVFVVLAMVCALGLVGCGSSDTTVTAPDEFLPPTQQASPSPAGDDGAESTTDNGPNQTLELQ